MIIKLFDKKEFYVTKDDADAVKRAIDGGADHIELGNEWIRCSAIATILEGGEPKPSDFIGLVERAEISDEDRAKARKRIAQIRKELFRKSKS